MFKTCDICGANLDPGERCDCDKTYEEARRKYDSLIDTKPFQMKFSLDGKEVNRYEHSR